MYRNKVYVPLGGKRGGGACNHSHVVTKLSTSHYGYAVCLRISGELIHWHGSHARRKTLREITRCAILQK